LARESGESIERAKEGAKIAVLSGPGGKTLERKLD
jgi:hypothetical protein